MSNEDIVQELERMDKQSKAIHSEAIRIAWWMKGGISLSEAYQLDRKQRSLISGLAEEQQKIANRVNSR